MFTLHPQLATDSIFVKDLPLSQLRLINNCLYPWLILVPRRDEIREIYQLNIDEQIILLQEMNTVSQYMQTQFAADKMNIAALGNMVPQLHIHVIARFEKDTAWPNPVWGQAVKTYSDEDLKAMLKRLEALS